ncbi:MAG: site-specific integrase, partial [Rhodopirellula sp.]|nr:site-specific integrase [Rhodopirellula sp.]
MSEIKVTVSRYGSGRHLVLRYTDPITGKRVARSAGTSDPTKAAKEAGRWEDELNTGRYRPPSRLTWKDFRERYAEEKLATLADKTFLSATSALNHLERVVNPDRLSKLTAATMSQFQAKLRAEGMKDTTIACHLRAIKSALSWAASVGLIPKVPRIERPKRTKGERFMRGRPVTAEEYERMLAAVPKARPRDPEPWKRLLTGLWLSGLRLGEAVLLSWDQDAAFCVQLSGRRPVFRIYSEAQKSNRDQLLPMTPDFAEWLLHTPEADRVGPVFQLPGLVDGMPVQATRAGEIIRRIGAKAGVVVDREVRWVNEKVIDPKTGEPTGERRRVHKEMPKYASAHDLRRAFANRWAPRVKPVVLQKLMRHADIQTTMKHYVDLDIDDMADELWASWGAEKGAGNTSGNTGVNRAASKNKASRNSLSRKAL